MFNLFRSQHKMVKYFLTFLLSMVALSMAVTLIPGLFSTPTADLNDPVLAEVGDQKVTIRDVQLVLGNVARSGQIPREQMGLMATRTINDEITSRVLLEEAAGLNLLPSEKELAEWIRTQLPFLFESGSFDAQQYKTFIQQRFQMPVPDFERQLRNDLTIENRLRAMVTGNIVVTEEQVKEIYREQNQMSQVAYAVIDASALRSEVEVTDEGLQAFFEGNKFRYQVPEKRSVKTATIVDDPSLDVVVQESELRNFYDQERYRFESQERVLASHILFMTINPDTGESLADEEVTAKEAKAQEVLAKVNAGEDFAELAKEYSEDPGTKESGGDLGWVESGQMTEAFEKATFGLVPDSTSDVVKTEFGYHIIKAHKRDAAVVQPFDEVRDQIEQDLKTERREAARLERTDRAVEQLRGATAEGFEQVARQLGFPIADFNDFDQSSTPPQLGATPGLSTRLFSSQVGEVILQAVDGRTIVALIASVTPAREMTLEEAAPRLRGDLITAEARKLAGVRAEELLAQAREAGGLAKIARRFRLDVNKSKFFKRGDFVDGLGGAQALGPQAFDGAIGDVAGPVNVAQGVAVYEVLGRSEADMDLYFDQRATLRKDFLDSQRDQAFEIFKALTLQRYEEEGRVRRYDNRIEQFLRLVSS